MGRRRRRRVGPADDRGGATSEHPGMGMASFVLSAATGLLFVGLALAAWLLSRAVPPGEGAAGWGVLFLFAGLSALLLEVAALALGSAGALQKDRKRRYAFLGVACSVLFLVIVGAWIVVVEMIGGPADGPPRIHAPSGNR